MMNKSSYVVGNGKKGNNKKQKEHVNLNAIA